MPTCHWRKFTIVIRDCLHIFHQKEMIRSSNRIFTMFLSVAEENSSFSVNISPVSLPSISSYRIFFVLASKRDTQKICESSCRITNSRKPYIFFFVRCFAYNFVVFSVRFCIFVLCVSVCISAACFMCSFVHLFICFKVKKKFETICFVHIVIAFFFLHFFGCVAWNLGTGSKRKNICWCCYWQCKRVESFSGIFYSHSFYNYWA